MIKKYKSTHLPLVAALQKYRNAGPARFHIPGHGGSGINDWQTWATDPFSMDVTEVSGLDDLHQAEGCIAEAQQLAAELYGADHTFFLVQGSTVGNQSMVLSTCQVGDVVLMQRNVHQSLVHAAVMAGVHVVWLWPETDAASGMAEGISVATVRMAFERYPTAKALILQHPNYYGHIRKDLTESIAIAHQHLAFVLVDEAHGAHFGMHPDLPQSALRSGADAVVQSTHKMAGAFTMGAMLHIQGTRIQPDLVRRTLRMLQSSSPSYLIMGSLDAVRGHIAENGHALFERTLAWLVRFHKQIDESKALQILLTHDPFKIILRDQTGSRNGYALQQWFESKGIIAEMADPFQMVCVVSWLTKDEDLKRLMRACSEYTPSSDPHEHIPVTKAAHLHFFHGINNVSNEPMTMPTIAEWIGLRGLSEQIIPLVTAAGRMVSDAITPYPPGIPLLFPGERITDKMIMQLLEWIEMGSNVKGIFRHDSSTPFMIRVRLES